MATLLTIAVFLPLLGAVGLILAPHLAVKTARGIALGIVLATLGAGLILLLGFDPRLAGPQFTSTGSDGGLGVPWIKGMGIRFALGLDGVSLWMFLSTGVLSVTAVLASWESARRRASTHYALVLALAGGLLGAFASLDLLLFYIFFEFILIPLFFLIGLFGGPERTRAAVTYFLYTLTGSLFTLIGMVALVAIHQRYTGILTFSIPELTEGLRTLPWDGWFATTSWTSPQVLIFLLLFAGFAVKVPMFPFHTYFPLAHAEAPAAWSILLVKIGGYGLYRFNLAMTPLGADYLFAPLAALSVIAILYGALAGLAQTDLKRLTAYSSVSHMGFFVLGLISLNGTGIDGAIIQMVNLGITAGAMFALFAAVADRYRTREIPELGGLWNWSPLWSFFLIVAAFGSAAVPFTNGFVGEFPILVGIYHRSPVHGSLAAIGMLLGAWYLFAMLRKVVFGPLREPIPAEAEGSDARPANRPLSWVEIGGIAPLIALILLVGIVPGPFLRRLRPSVAPVIAVVQGETKWARDQAYALANPPVVLPTPPESPPLQPRPTTLPLLPPDSPR